MKAIIKPLLGNGKKVISNGADVLAKNGKNGLNGNGNGIESLARASANAEVAKVKANQSTFVPEVEETRLPTANYAVDDAIDNHLTKKRGTVDVSMPLEELESTLIADLRRVGVKGDINLMAKKRRAGPLGQGQTPYRNYQEMWMTHTDRPQKESLYAELEGERFFGDVKEKGKRLAIRNVRQKLDETVTTMSSRDLAITLQTIDPKELKTWNRSLQAAPRGWEAHHLNMIKLMSVLTEGLNPDQARNMFKHLGRRHGLYTGNSVFNKVNLPADIHDWVHAEMTKIGLEYRKALFDENTPIRERVKYMLDYVNKMKHIQRYIYKKMSARKVVRSKLRPENRQFRVN